MVTVITGEITNDKGETKRINDLLENDNASYYLGDAYNLNVTDSELKTEYRGYLIRATGRGKGTQTEGSLTEVGLVKKITANGDFLWWNGLSTLVIRRVQRFGKERR